MKQEAQAISREDVQAQLERVVRSELFANAGRLGPFLRFLVETVLDGRGSELKESTVGVSVFGRAADYDPRTDPIVRVEARRLRARLADYYAGVGQSDPVILDLPKGTYVPVFTRRKCTPLQPVASTRRSWVWLAIGAGLIAVGLTWMLVRRSAAPKVSSVAVLPFVNVSADPTNEYFSDGLTDELIDTLSRVSGLKVIGRSLVFQQKGRAYDIQSLARSWQVGAVVEGSVRKSGDRLRITAQLTNATDGYNLWSETYDRELKDVFAVQKEISAAIARALRVRLAAGAGDPAPANPQAYHHLLEARYQFNRFTPEGYRLAFRALDQAIGYDPQYGAAHTLKAHVYAMAGYYYVVRPAEAWAKARQAAERALEIDSDSGEAHAARGFVLGLSEWRWADSEREFRRAIELEPGSAYVHAGYATACLMPQGRLTEAVAEYRKSLEIDPLVVFSNMGAGFALQSLKRYEEAVAHYDRALELNSVFPDIWWDKGMALAFLGRNEKALECFRKAAVLEGSEGQWSPGPAALALIGDTAGAVRIIEKWARQNKPDEESHINVARIYGVTGDVSKTMEWLEGAWQVREPQLVWLKVDPRFEKVRQAPEFQAMTKRLGL